jgi:hypothetical protein
MDGGEHIWADREASRFAAAWDEKSRFEGDLRAAFNATLDQGGHGVADVALQAARLLAAKLSDESDFARRARRQLSWRLSRSPGRLRIIESGASGKGGFAGRLFLVQTLPNMSPSVSVIFDQN